MQFTSIPYRLRKEAQVRLRRRLLKQKPNAIMTLVANMKHTPEGLRRKIGKLMRIVEVAIHGKRRYLKADRVRGFVAIEGIGTKGIHVHIVLNLSINFFAFALALRKPLHTLFPGGSIKIRTLTSKRTRRKAVCYTCKDLHGQRESQSWIYLQEFWPKSPER